MSELFHVAEYNSLKAEILLKMKQVDDSFRFMLIAVAASMTWTISNYQNFKGSLPVVLFFVPLFISVSFTLYIMGLNKSVLWRTAYIRDLERRFGEEGFGWESSPQHDRFARKRTSYATARGVVIAVNLIAVLFAGYMMVDKTHLLDAVTTLIGR